MGRKSGSKVDKAWVKGVESALDLVEQAMKLKGIGPVTQQKILDAMRELANKKKEGK